MKISRNFIITLASLTVLSGSSLAGERLTEMTLMSDIEAACHAMAPESAFLDQDIEIRVVSNDPNVAPHYWLENFEQTAVLNEDTVSFENISSEHTRMRADGDKAWNAGFKFGSIDRASMPAGHHETKLTLGIECKDAGIDVDAY